MKKLFVLFALLSGCGEDYYCYQNYYENISDFPINPDKKTLKGVRVDTSGYAINLARLDERMDKIESCIKDIMAVRSVPEPKWQCLKERFNPEENLKRDCLVIKLVKPVYSKCSNWQFIGIKAPDEFCKAKGLEVTPECPCMWRTAIQDENIIISPPPETRALDKSVNIEAPYLWEIGRMMTSCNDTWRSPFAKCLSF